MDSPTLIILSVIQMIVLILTLIFIAIQSLAQKKALNEMKNDRRASTISNLTKSIIDVDFMLIDNIDLAKKLGYSKEDILAFLMINIFEEKYHFFKEGLIVDSDWEANKAFIKDYINRDFIFNVWERREHVYDSEFRNLLNGLIIRQKNSESN